VAIQPLLSRREKTLQRRPSLKCGNEKKSSDEPFPIGMRRAVPAICATLGQEHTMWVIAPAKKTSVLVISARTYPHFPSLKRRFCPIFQSFLSAVAHFQPKIELILRFRFYYGR